MIAAGSLFLADGEGYLSRSRKARRARHEGVFGRVRTKIGSHQDRLKNSDLPRRRYDMVGRSLLAT
jgi:hypothetical protein